MNNIVYLHIICAFLSLLLLIVRGAMQLADKNWRAIKLLKILPHLTDTLLIVSGFILVFGLGYGFPWWIILKILLLAAYILFSAKFFSRKTDTANPLHFISAVGAFLGIMAVAYFH